MKDLWIQDIMLQKFLNSDVTRVLILLAMTSSGELKCAYKKREIIEFIYRCYSDNPDAASINPDYRIRNISKYGLSDIKGVLENALKEWKYYAVNNILQEDDRFIYLCLGNEEDRVSLARYTQQIGQMIQRKYFSVEVRPPSVLDREICKLDKDLDNFGTSLYRNRLLEDMQYCPLCEETNIGVLVAVHILPYEMSKESDSIIDKNNGLIMCREHAQDYLDGKFVFKENGFVENISSDLVNEKMHLSIQIKNPKRRRYIKEYYESMNIR